MGLTSPKILFKLVYGLRVLVPHRCYKLGPYLSALDAALDLWPGTMVSTSSLRQQACFWLQPLCSEQCFLLFGFFPPLYKDEKHISSPKPHMGHSISGTLTPTKSLWTLLHPQDGVQNIATKVSVGSRPPWARWLCFLLTTLGSLFVLSIREPPFWF